jgi:hypothetical protein
MVTKILIKVEEKDKNLIYNSFLEYEILKVYKVDG